MTDKEKEIDLMARTAWGEARGEGATGMQAVINVIMNRVKAGRWWGRTVKDVVLKPYQFSCWNEGDSNRSKILSVNISDASFARAKYLAKLGYDSQLADITNGATHYHTAGITPVWSASMEQTQVLGNHKFYKEA